MKNEKKLFNAGLYFDGIKQLKLVGILFTAVIALGAILIPVTPAVISMSARGFDIKDVIPEPMSGFANMLAVGLPLLGAPVMVFVLFSFLNKRNTSDFYHSLPHTRTCVFLSLFASVMTWVVFALILTGSLSVICMLILRDFYAILWKDFLIYHLGCFVASLLSAAVAAAAMSVTGTAFSNLVMFLLMMFMPRFLITLVSMGVYEALPMLSSGHMTAFLSYDINIINGMVFGLFAEMFGLYGSLGGVAGCITNTTSIIYTSVMGIIMTVCACLLFNFRKSESAAKSAPNRFLQATYRILVTMVYFSVVIAAVFIENSHSSGIDLFFYFVLGIIGLAIYFAYELITTKKFKNLLKAIPGLAIVAGLCVVMFGTMYAVTRVQLSFTPEPDEILSVAVAEEGESEGSISFREYAGLSSSSIDLTDAELKKLVSENLKENTEYFKEKGYFRFMEKYEWSYRYDSVAATSDSYVVRTFKITTLTGDHYRKIYFKEDDLDTVSEAVSRDKAYKELWLTLPENVENTSFINTSNAAWYEIESKEIDKWIDIARSELKKADFAAWYAKDNHGNGSLCVIEYMIESGPLAGEYVYVPVTPDIFPETSQLFMDSLSKHQQSEKNFEKAKEILGELNIDGDYVTATQKGYFDIRIHVYDEDLGGYKSHIAKYGSADTGTVEFILSKAEDRAADISSKEAFIVLNLSLDDVVEIETEFGVEYQSKYAEVVLAMPGLTEEELKSYFDLTNVSY